MDAITGDAIMLRDLEAESVLLYNIAYMPKRRKEIFSQLTEEDFEHASNKQCFRFAMGLYERSQNMETNEVRSRIFDLELGKVSRKYKLYDAIKCVKGYTYRRNLQRLGNILQQASMDVTKTQEEVRSIITEAIEYTRKCDVKQNQSVHISTAIENLLTNLQKKPARYVTWGYKGLDFARLEPGTLCTFAARPGTGKTAFITSSCLKMAIEKVKTGIICIEMDNEQIATRMLVQTSGYSYSEIRYQYSQLRQETIEKSKKALMHIDCHLHCGHKVNINDIEEIASDWVFKGVQVIFIDYLQLMDHGKSEKRYISVGETSKQLKMLARKLEIPIVLLAQLNRDAADTQPKVHHLKESGQIEENSDIVMLLDRKLKPNDPFTGRNYTMETELGYEKVDMDNHAAILVDKNRNGPLGAFFPQFIRKEMTFL